MPAKHPGVQPASLADVVETSKVRTASQAIAAVADGDHIAIGGCLYSRTPMALLFELLRQRTRALTISRSLMCYEAELLFVTGQSCAVETSWLGFGGRWGMLGVIRDAIERGDASYLEYSHLGIAMRYRGGAMGIPYLPMRSMLGSDLLERTDAEQVTCPFTGESLVAVPALQPDVGLIHAHRGDDRGNVQIDGYQHMDRDIARAAKHVIVSVEEIVSHDEIMAQPDATVIPHFVVDSVVEAPHGAYPHEMYGLYDANFAHFDAYAARVRASGADGVRQYVAEHVDRHPDFAAFIASFPVEDLDHSQAMVKELL